MNCTTDTQTRHNTRKIDDRLYKYRCFRSRFLISRRMNGLAHAIYRRCSCGTNIAVVGLFIAIFYLKKNRGKRKNRGLGFCRVRLNPMLPRDLPLFYWPTSKEGFGTLNRRFCIYLKITSYSINLPKQYNTLF